MSKLSRRDFIKLSSLALGGLALSPFSSPPLNFDDSVVVRIATAEMPIRRLPTDKSEIYRTVKRDELVHVYEEVVAEEPTYNPVWFRVWGGYLHRGRIQHVKFLRNEPLSSFLEGQRYLAEVTIPFTQPWRFTKTYGWKPLEFRMYYASVHWIEAVEEGPDGAAWYQVFDELIGKYYVAASHLRPIPPEEWSPISPEIPWEDKNIEVDLTTQTLIAYEHGKAVFRTKISSGLPGHTSTSRGKFNVDPKTPSKHMGNGDLFAGVEDYELPGVPWTSFFTGDGQAFHGTYWHENFGTPMSHGCINMRTEDARWIYRWVRPIHDPEFVSSYKPGAIDSKGFGTQVEIHY